MFSGKGQFCSKTFIFNPTYYSDIIVLKKWHYCIVFEKEEQTLQSFFLVSKKALGTSTRTDSILVATHWILQREIGEEGQGACVEPLMQSLFIKELSRIFRSYQQSTAIFIFN